MSLGLKGDAKEGQHCSLQFLGTYEPIPSVLDSGRAPGGANVLTHVWVPLIFGEITSPFSNKATRVRGKTVAWAYKSFLPVI